MVTRVLATGIIGRGLSDGVGPFRKAEKKSGNEGSVWIHGLIKNDRYDILMTECFYWQSADKGWQKPKNFDNIIQTVTFDLFTPDFSEKNRGRKPQIPPKPGCSCGQICYVAQIRPENANFCFSLP